MIQFRFSFLPCLTLGLALPASPCHAGTTCKQTGTSPPGSVAPGWEWRLSAGPAYRHFGGVDFDTGFYSTAAMFPVLVPQLSAGRADSLEALGLGSTSAFADRTYGDGFVFMDDNTSAPNSFLPGTTASWGYQNDSQVQSCQVRRVK